MASIAVHRLRNRIDDVAVDDGQARVHQRRVHQVPEDLSIPANHGRDALDDHHLGVGGEGAERGAQP